MNITAHTGRLGQDAELKTVGDNLEIMEFSIFVKDYKKSDPNNGFWLNVTHFKPNDYLKDLCKKGNMVAVSGKLNITSHDKKYYTKILSHNIEVFPKGGATGGESTAKAEPSKATEGEDDDLPF